MNPKSNLITLSAAILMAAPIAAQADSEAASKPKPFVLAAGELDVKELIDHCAAFLGCNVLSDQAEIGQAPPVRLQKSVISDQRGCKELLANLLFRSGFALTVLDKEREMFEAIMINGRRGREIQGRAEWKTTAQILAQPRLKMPVMTIVKLEHINAPLANNALRPFFSGMGSGAGDLSIGNLGSSSGLILSGMQDQVASALTLIKAGDVEQPPSPYRGKDLPGYVAKLEQRLEQLEAKLAKLTAANK